jgi:hypothetical protein
MLPARPRHPDRLPGRPYNPRQRPGAVHVGSLPGGHSSGATMKAILATVVVFGLCGLAAAQGSKADPVGTWKCEYEIGGQQREATLAIKKDGDKLTGTMSFQDGQEAKLKDLKVKDGELTFSVERKVMDMTFTVEYKLKVEGDKLTGKGAVHVGDEKREFDIEGKREKK